MPTATMENFGTEVMEPLIGMPTPLWLLTKKSENPWGTVYEDYAAMGMNVSRAGKYVLKNTSTGEDVEYEINNQWEIVVPADGWEIVEQPRGVSFIEHEQNLGKPKYMRYPPTAMTPPPVTSAPATTAVTPEPEESSPAKWLLPAGVGAIALLLFMR